MTAAAGGSGFLRLALSFFPHHFPLHRNGVGAFPLNSTLPLLWSSFFFRCYAQGFDFFFSFSVGGVSKSCLVYLVLILRVRNL